MDRVIMFRPIRSRRLRMRTATGICSRTLSMIGIISLLKGICISMSRSYQRYTSVIESEFLGDGVVDCGHTTRPIFCSACPVDPFSVGIFFHDESGLERDGGEGVTGYSDS